MAATSTIAEIELEVAEIELEVAEAKLKVAEAKIKVAKAARIADAKIEADKIIADKKRAAVLEYKAAVFSPLYVSEWVKQDIADLQQFVDYNETYFRAYGETRIMRCEFHKYIDSVDNSSSQDHKELCTILAVLKRSVLYKEAAEKEWAGGHVYCR